MSAASGSAAASSKDSSRGMWAKKPSGAGRVLGVGAVLEVVAADVAVDLVARLEPGDRGADLLDHPGDVPAEDDREVERELGGQVAAADL